MNFKQLCIALLFISGTAPVQAISFVDYSPDKAMTMGVFALFMGICMKLAKDKYDSAHNNHAQAQSPENAQVDHEMGLLQEPQPMWPETTSVPEEVLFPTEALECLVDQSISQHDELYEYLTSTC